MTHCIAYSLVLSFFFCRVALCFVLFLFSLNSAKLGQENLNERIVANPSNDHQHHWRVTQQIGNQLWSFSSITPDCSLEGSNIDTSAHTHTHTTLATHSIDFNLNATSPNPFVLFVLCQLVTHTTTSKRLIVVISRWPVGVLQLMSPTSLLKTFDSCIDPRSSMDDDGNNNNNNKHSLFTY